MNERPPAKVSLEDILQLKRAERPAPEFWSSFEKELRTKQLAAIVERRPWWSSLPRYLARAPRWSLPLGAAAAAAIVAVAVLNERAGTSRSEPAVIAAHPVAVKVAAQGGDVSREQLAADRVSSTLAPTSSPATASTANPGAHESTPASAVSPAELGRLLAGLGEPATAVSQAGASSPRESVPAVSEIASVEPTAASLDETTMVMQEADVDAGLARTFTPRDGGRQRLLADISYRESSTGDFDSNADVVRSREHIISRLAERSLYDQMSRIGFQQGGVTFKF